MSMKADERGSLLLFVVWTVALLSLFAASVASHAAFALGLTERLSDQLRASYAARAAVPYAMLALEDDQSPQVDGTAEPWSDDPRLWDRAVGGGTFNVMAGASTDGRIRHGLTDEDRAINLNTAPADVLRRLAQLAAGLREDDAIALAAAIEDWRDENDQPVQKGAEGIYYRGLEDGYDCKNGPFESLEELMLVRGITPELYGYLAPHVTVYGSGKVNVNTADRLVLRALGLSETGVDGAFLYRAGEDNIVGTSDDRALNSPAALTTEWAPYVPAEDLARLTPLLQEGFLDVGSTAFRMEIEARAGSSGMVHAFCVIDREGAIRRWNEW